jgi:hypothetical protein
MWFKKNKILEIKKLKEIISQIDLLASYNFFYNYLLKYILF